MNSYAAKACNDACNDQKYLQLKNKENKRRQMWDVLGRSQSAAAAAGSLLAKLRFLITAIKHTRTHKHTYREKKTDLKKCLELFLLLFFPPRPPSPSTRRHPDKHASRQFVLTCAAIRAH